METTEKLRSLNLGAALVDQAEEIIEDIYLELNGRIRLWSPESIEAWRREFGPSLMASLGYVPTPYNQLICVGNPAPNWAKDRFKLQRRGKVTLFEAGTKENERYLPAGYIDQLKEQYPEEWVKRFIEGDWDTFGGAVFKDFNIGGIHGVEPFDAPTHWPRFVGHDHGFTNATAVIPSAIDEDGNIIVLGEYYASGRTVKENAGEIKDMLALYKTNVGHDGRFLTHMDPSTAQHNGVGQESIWDAYLAEGIFGLKANNEKEAGILYMQQLLKPDASRPFPSWHPKAGQMGSPRIFFTQKRCPNLVNELQIYEWEESRLGYNKSEQPKKVDDHAIDACRYMCMAVRDNRAEKLPESEGDAERQRRLENERMAWVFSREEDPDSWDPRDQD